MVHKVKFSSENTLLENYFGPNFDGSKIVLNIQKDKAWDNEKLPIIIFKDLFYPNNL